MYIIEYITFWTAFYLPPLALQVEREKTALLMNLQESQTQLQHTQGALSEQNERVHRLMERVSSMKCLNGDKELGDPQQNEKADNVSLSTPTNGHHDPDINGFEILECKYKVAVMEVIDLKAELKALKEKYNQAVEGQRESHGEDRVQPLTEQVCLCLCLIDASVLTSFQVWHLNIGYLQNSQHNYIYCDGETILQVCSGVDCLFHFNRLISATLLMLNVFLSRLPIWSVVIAIAARGYRAWRRSSEQPQAQPRRARPC